MSESIITVASLATCLDRNPVLIDVRSPAEFESCHPRGAVNLPLDRLDAEALKVALQGRADSPVYLMCQAGTRAKMAGDKLSRAGVADCVVVEGGLNAWRAAGLPVVMGKQSMSIERQVRIVVGVLVIVGTTIGWTVHPAGFLLAGFVGAGLIFAGITDTCGMAIMLSKMPWNRGGGPSTGAGCSIG